jgi:two-component system sensor histidine kinase MtrB
MDTLQASAGAIRLDEKIVDVRDVITRVAQLWTGPGSTHEIRIAAPAAPVWAFVDGERLERVVLNLVGKIMQYSPQGGRIDLALRVSSSGQGEKGGIELLISEGSQTGERVRATGPEQDLLKHWVAENGFGLGLSQKIVAAHGGQIMAAGVAGTHVVFTIRLPEERLPVGMDLVGGIDQPGLAMRSKAGRDSGLSVTDRGGFESFQPL